MRDLGYSLETAIADLVDNSISADATKVDIFCDLTQQHPTLGIIDNGHGMDEAGIVDALRHGSKKSVGTSFTEGPWTFWPWTQDCLLLPM
nr:ATP-binding protein [Celeribacter sp. HF31]